MKNIAKKIVIKILTLEAKLVLKKYKPKIVAVTGSVGKTSTKDAVYTALHPFFFVRKSAKSFNNELGIPLTILGLPNAWNDHKEWLQNMFAGFMLVIGKTKYPEWLVLEIGADHPGEIKDVMKWVHPDVSVITRIGDVPVHVEFYKSINELILEKSYLARGLNPDGTLVINSDDEDVVKFKEFTSAKALTFGINDKSGVKASFIKPLYEEGKVKGISFKVDVDGSSIPVSLKGVYGNQFVYPVLAAFGVVSTLELNPLKAVDAFSEYEYPRGRMNIIEGVNGSTILDDTYNASPVAMEEGFRATDGLECSGRKIAIVGDMLELGKFSQDEHYRLGEMASYIFDIVALVGIRAGEMKAALLSKGFKEENIYIFNDSVEAGEAMKEKISEFDLVYVKGSQGMRMERVVERIMADPKQKDKLLVRMEKEWVTR